MAQSFGLAIESEVSNSGRMWEFKWLWLNTEIKTAMLTPKIPKSILLLCGMSAFENQTYKRQINICAPLINGFSPRALNK